MAPARFLAFALVVVPICGCERPSEPSRVVTRQERIPSTPIRKIQPAPEPASVEAVSAPATDIPQAEPAKRIKATAPSRSIDQSRHSPRQNSVSAAPGQTKGELEVLQSTLDTDISLQPKTDPDPRKNESSTRGADSRVFSLPPPASAVPIDRPLTIRPNADG
jgi:hypothetical protein